MIRTATHCVVQTTASYLFNKIWMSFPKYRDKYYNNLRHSDMLMQRL